MEILNRYLPVMMLERFSKNSSPIEKPEQTDYKAGVLFADISGFSKITEQLALKGEEGVNELTGILDLYIGKLVDIIMLHGGDIIKFAGDALFAIWPSNHTDSLAIQVHRTVQCALDMQKKMHNYQVCTSGLTLAMRIAVGCGKLNIIYIGGIFNRWEILMAGDPMNQVGEGSQGIEPGSVVVSRQAKRRMESIDGAKLKNKKVILFNKIEATKNHNNLFVPVVSDEAEESMLSFIPRAISSRVESGLEAQGSEIRNVTVMFLNITNFVYSYEMKPEEIQEIMEILQRGVYSYKGSINRFGIDDKGSILLTGFGLPPLNDDEDAKRAVQSGQLLLTTLEKNGFKGKIGIATGLVFCGSVGNARRSEYTFHGPSVNFAARLMMAANSILCDEVTYNLTKEDLQYRKLEPIHVKGKENKVKIYEPV